MFVRVIAAVVESCKEEDLLNNFTTAKFTEGACNMVPPVCSPTLQEAEL